MGPEWKVNSFSKIPICIFEKEPTFTVNVLLVIVTEGEVLVAVIVFNVPTCVTVKLCVNVPDENALDVVGEINPAFVVMFTVPVNVAVFVKKSFADMVTEKEVPAVCGDEIVLIVILAIVPPICDKVATAVVFANVPVKVPPVFVIVPADKFVPAVDCT